MNFFSSFKKNFKNEIFSSLFTINSHENKILGSSFLESKSKFSSQMFSYIPYRCGVLPLKLLKMSTFFTTYHVICKWNL
jgi:hypothetical protein